MKVYGDGTIEGLVAGGLPAAVIQQPNMAPNVAANGPCFSAYCSASAPIVNATNTKAPFQTEEFDTGNCYDAANSRFQPNVPGYYWINAVLYLSGGASFEKGLFLYKNGAIYKVGNDNISSWQIGGSWLVYLNGTTDYVEIYGYQGSGADQTFGPSSIYTIFQGFLARAA